MKGYFNEELVALSGSFFESTSVQRGEYIITRPRFFLRELRSHRTVYDMIVSSKCKQSVFANFGLSFLLSTILLL